VGSAGDCAGYSTTRSLGGITGAEAKEIATVPEGEAVRQLIERGHPVVEVAARLGVSIRSLYKWLRAVRPSRDEVRSESFLIVTHREDV